MNVVRCLHAERLKHLHPEEFIQGHPSDHLQQTAKHIVLDTVDEVRAGLVDQGLRRQPEPGPTPERSVLLLLQWLVTVISALPGVRGWEGARVDGELQPLVRVGKVVELVLHPAEELRELRAVDASAVLQQLLHRGRRLHLAARVEAGG